jgi:2-succinyl-6-hydroxy-2,4-cyclohexadiene-1-carboxylate synthase
MALLHGFLGSPASWDRVRAHLVGRGPVEAIALQGHGETPLQRTVTSFEDELARMIEERGPRGWPSTLVGYSLGARVALGLAARAPAPFDRLVLVSGRDGLRDPEEARARRAHDDALADVLRHDGLAAFVDRWEALPLFDTQRGLPEEIRSAHRARRLAHDPEGVARALSVLSLGRMPRFADAAVSRTARVDLVVGALDVKFRQLAEELSREHATIRLHVVPGAGHDVVLERPDALAAILEERA